MKFKSAFGKVELTEERYDHICKFHPEIRHYYRYFAQALIKPQIVRRSKSDPNVLILYRKIKTQFLAIVIKTNTRNFILTAYLTYKIQHQKL